MSKGKKIAITMVIILLILAIAIGGIIAIVGNRNNGNLDDITRTERLATPKNVAISDDWVLTWNLVDKAIGYYVLIDNQKNEIVQTNRLDVSKYATIGEHTFCVRAMHSLASFHSEMSSAVTKTKTMKLDTPMDVSISSLVFSWGRVAEAKSYELLIEANNQTPVTQYSQSTQFDLSSYLASHLDVTRFTVKVKATARDIANNTSNKYIEDSDYSEVKTYVRPGTVTAPVLTANFGNGAKTQKGDRRTITWNIDPYIQTYLVKLDENVVATISQSDVVGVASYTLVLSECSSISDRLGTHSVQIEAVPMNDDSVPAETLQSNKIAYSVNQKLEAVVTDSIVVSMEGKTLVVEWGEISLANYYNLELRGKMGGSEQFISIPIPDTMISGARYSMELVTPYQEVQARVMALAQKDHEFVQDADWSGWSQSYSTITKLNTVGEVRISEGSDEKVTASWSGNNQNSAYVNYIGSYYCIVYYSSIKGGVKERGEIALEFSLDKNVETFIVSDRLKDKGLAAGLYSLTIKTLPNDDYRNFFTASDATNDAFFNYKTRLDMPTGLHCERMFNDDGTSVINFSFYGTIGAQEYLLTITGGDVHASVTISQPANYAGEQIVDTTVVQGILGGMTEPQSYTFTLTAIAPVGENAKLMDSIGVDYTYADIFKHSAVDVNSIEFTQTGNTVVASWGSVSTATSYDLRINNTTLTVTSNSYDITHILKLGENTFSIACGEIAGRYRASATVGKTYTYIYTITGSAEIESKLVETETGKYVEVSIPHFDDKITGYAIKFGDGEPRMMTLDTENGRAYILATIDGENVDLPLYVTTEVTVYAGVKAVESGVVSTQDYLSNYKGITANITNDYSITAPTLSAESGTLTITLEGQALKFTDKVTFTISMGGRILYNGDIARQEFYNDETNENIKSVFTYNLSKLIKGDETISLDVGVYRIGATIYATSGISAGAEVIEYTMRTKLDKPTGFEQASDNTYLQWGAVADANSYTVSVKHDGETVTDVTMPIGEQLINSKWVVRLNTIELFGKYGVGTYTFTVTACSDNTNIEDSDSAEYTWTMSTTLTKPIFSVEKYSGTDTSLVGKVCAKILKSALAEKYIITVNGGESKTVDKNSTDEIYQYVDLGITYGGKYEIVIKSIRNSGDNTDESEPAIANYTNVVSASKPNNVGATQDLENDTITLYSDQVTQTIVNNRSISDVELSVEAKISTLTYQDYAKNGETVWFELVLSSDSGRMYVVLDNDVKDWLSSSTDTMYLVSFRTKAYSIDGEVILETSEETMARWSYQNRLSTPTFTVSGIVTPNAPATLEVSGLDSKGNNAIDIQITRGDWSRTFGAQLVTDNKVQITAEMLEDTRGEYSISIRATSNGMYVASVWSETKTISCAMPLDDVANIKFSRIYTKNGDSVTEAKLSITFDPVSKPSAVDYAVKLSIGDTSLSYELIQDDTETSKVKFTLDYSDKNDLLSILGETPQANLVLNFDITATPAPASTQTNLYLENITKYVYTVGAVTAPQNFVFTQNGKNVTVTWSGDDNYAGNEYITTYTYNVIIKDNQGNEISGYSLLGKTATETTATFNLPNDYNTQAYLSEFVITKVEVKKDGTTVATFDGTSSDWYVNTVATTGEASLDVTYDIETKKYTGSITHTSNNGELFKGQTYDIIIAGSVVASGLGATTFELGETVVSRLISASSGQIANYEIIVSNALYTDNNNKSMVAYKGASYNGQVRLPLVINSAPTRLKIDNTNYKATITNIPYVTKYSWRIAKQGGTDTLRSGNVDVGSNVSAIDTQFDLVGITGLSAGKYILYVKAESDIGNKIYADDAQEIDMEFDYTVSMREPYNTTVTTNGNEKGDFATTLSWNYPNELDKTRFLINFVNTATGASYNVEMNSMGENFAVASEGGYFHYTLVFKGLDLINGSDLGYDLTRTMPAGDYKITIQVLGSESEHSTDSAVKEFEKIYKNMFGVVAVKDASAFAIAPECFFGSSNIENGVISFGESEAEKKVYLEKYESVYGFNRKYLVITRDGYIANKATSYRIFINGVDFGIIDKNSSITEISFDSINNATKLSLNDVWRAGINTITLMPYTSNEMLDYYYYVDGKTSYKLDTEIAQNKLTSQFDVAMYQKFSTPSDPRVELGYSDNAKHNINKVNVSFANSSSDIMYDVVVKYNDYYDNNTVKTYISLSNQKAVFNGSQNLGIELYNIIKTMGPHNVWFEIRQTGKLSNESSKEYYINSDVVTTIPFIYTTAMPEFSDRVISGKVTSVVTEINSSNQDADKSYKLNGALMWTLPINAYDMVAEYVVTLKDVNGNIATKKARLKLAITDDGIKYELVENDNELFYIDSENIYFDMTKFFWNKEAGLTNGTRSSFYLAGDYYYQITAKALDKNGIEAENRIYAPEKPNYGFNKYVYKDINYPVAPTDAIIDKDGVLSWKYATAEDIYSSEDPVFEIVITTYKASDKSLLQTITLGPTSNTQFDISSYLVAGGVETNSVSVYRKSPSEFYKDSLPTKAGFANDYVSNHSMPNISAEWNTKYNIEYAITDSREKVETVISELNANGSSAEFVISMLRVSQTDSVSLDESANFDSVIASGVQYVRIDFASIEFDVNTSSLNYRYNLLNAIETMSKSSEWLSGTNFIAGKYFVKVEFRATDHPYYTASTKYIMRDIKEVWSVVNNDDTTLTGEYLTTKDKTVTTPTVTGQNDRNWAETDHKEAILSFNVYTIKDSKNVPHLPTSVTVRVKLWNGSTYVTDRIYEYKYTLPRLADLLNDMNASYKISEDGDSYIYRVNGTTDYYNVKIDVHKLFDYTEPYAANYAGVYALEYMLNDDAVGSASDAMRSDGSQWYLYNRDVCHYTVIPTPILDYRLGMQQIGAEYVYVLNWVLTPNKYTYIVNNDVDYNLNIFAFKKTNGEYACDDAYNTIDDDKKKFFLQNESATSSQMTSYGFRMEKLIKDFNINYENQEDGRRCYINEKTNVGLDLEPNNEYKFYVYLTPKTRETNDPNTKYYLASATSAPQEYLYKAISSQHYGAEIIPTIDDVYVVENQEEFLDAKVYTITSNQDTKNYNNGFELFVYDTQDPSAGQTNTWMLDQEANKTYLAHYIITTLNNVSSNGNRVPLYVVDNSLYVEGKNQPLEYLRNADGSLRQVGVLVNSSIEISGFALSELLGENRSITPITYYCKIKAWINNNEINANAFVDDEGMLEDVTLYGEKWVRKYITQDDVLVNKYLEAFGEQGIQKTVKLADFNNLNPSYYFTFQHTIRFMQPSISKIELVNNNDATDVVDDCEVDYTNVSSGVTAGYIKANSEANYSFKIYLNNVYNVDPTITLDKYIQLNVAILDYDKTDNGILDFSNDKLISEFRSTTLKVHYDGTTSYVLLSKNSTETNAVAIYNWIDENLPNKIYFTATAVMGNPNQSETAGGENTTNKFIPNAQDGNKSSVGYGLILRSFVSSQMSNSVSIIVRKQYVAPLISYRFDNTTSNNLIGTTATQKTLAGHNTNVLSSGEYSGMALNPYLYVDGATYESIGAQGGGQANNGFEYIGLSNRTNTKYEVVFGYNDKTLSCEFYTKDINATMVEFNKAVRESSLRYDYANYKDIYPYEVACLYQKLYNLINDKNSDASDYHGGEISAKIRVIAPTDNEEDAGYWVSSEYRESDVLSFYVRLETVQTEFDSSEAQFADLSGTLNMATIYTNEGFYYYYQGYIPFKYNTISKNVKYRVILTRPNSQSTGNFVYSYETLRNANLTYSKCEWTPSVSGTNVGNLADILSIDQYPNSRDPDQNQWILDGEWSINILAYADNDLKTQFVTRGFDSGARTYTPKLKIVNDITNIAIKMDVDLSKYSVGDFGADNITVTSSAKTLYNSATNEAEFTYDLGDGKKTKNIAIKQNVGATCYYDMVEEFIRSVYINNSSVIGGKYLYSVRLLNNLNNVENSDTKGDFVFEYYRQIKAEDFSATVEQESTSNGFMTIKASVGKNMTISAIDVKLAQTLLASNASVLSIQKSMARSTSGANYAFNATWDFNKNYADCFLNSTDGNFSTNDITKLTQRGYVTSNNKGYIQAGYNTFYLYPVQDSASAKYNLWATGSYISRTAVFKVPSSYDPTIELSYSTSSENKKEYGDRYIKNGYYYIDVYETVYTYVDIITAKTANTSGYIVNSSWTYGWKKNSSETTCAKTEFSNRNSTQNLAVASSVEFPSNVNYVNYSITLSVKSGFAQYFVNDHITKEIRIDVSDQHYEHKFKGSSLIGVVP